MGLGQRLKNLLGQASDQQTCPADEEKEEEAGGVEKTRETNNEMLGGTKTYKGEVEDKVFGFESKVGFLLRC